MNFAASEAVANAILFEGYILYPYRPSALKNQQRWNFGTLYPRSFAERQDPPERWCFSAQILLQAEAAAALTAQIRFLQLVSPANNAGQDWAEGFARSRTLDGIPLEELCTGVERHLALGPLAADELPNAPPGYSDKPRTACLALRAEQLRVGLYRLHASLMNQSPIASLDYLRSQIQDVAFTSAHLLLGVENGNFASLLEPTQDTEAYAEACTQDGVFPVLVGEQSRQSQLLCSPIILYDYPQIAPESSADFFDATEMDEMLALRVLTLTDDERAEIMRSDRRARELLQHTEVLPDEHLAKIHGAVRELRAIGGPAAEDVDDAIDPWDPFAERPALETVHVLGVELRKGDRVRLWPTKHADILDMAVEGKVAVIEAIEEDLENNVQLAVVLEDDPGRDLGMLRQAGHRFFYAPEEVEPLPREAQ